MKNYRILLLLPLFILCQAFLSMPGKAPAVSIKLIVGGLNGPVAMDSPKDKTGRLFVCEQTGKIKIVKANLLLEKPFLDLSNKLDRMNKNYSEKGLLGLAFHPEYAVNGRFYVFYSAPASVPGFDHKSVVAEYKVSANRDIADPNSQKIILEINQPESNHNGGQLAFGPDGYLYIGVGDGGGAGDQHGTGGNGQDLNTLLGKILRIDVNTKSPYTIPKDNPFVNKPDTKAEIWAYGLRNPWRFSFDSKNGRLFCGDVGQDKWEEIDIITKGKNYGWRIMEATHCFSPKVKCKQAGLEMPIAEYEHGNEFGLCVTGGYMYWGKSVPALQGKYVFADWVGKLFYFEQKGEAWEMQALELVGRAGNNAGFSINSLGVDENGELYALGQGQQGTASASGALYQFVK